MNFMAVFSDKSSSPEVKTLSIEHIQNLIQTMKKNFCLWLFFFIFTGLISVFKNQRIIDIDSMVESSISPDFVLGEIVFDDSKAFKVDILDLLQRMKKEISLL